MFLRKCMDCGRVVWPWQQSDLGGGTRGHHVTCHAKTIAASMAESPEVAGMYRAEFMQARPVFGSKTIDLAEAMLAERKSR
jgi:hypothetical protein